MTTTWLSIHFVFQKLPTLPNHFLRPCFRLTVINNEEISTCIRISKFSYSTWNATIGYSCSSVMCTYSRIRELLSLAKNFELSIAFLLTSSTPKNLYSCRQSGLSFTSYRFTNTKFKMADPMDFLGISAEEKVCLCH